MVAPFLSLCSVVAWRSTHGAGITKLAVQFSIQHDEMAAIVVSTIGDAESN